MKHRKPGSPNVSADNARKAMYKRAKKRSDPNMSYYIVIGGFCLCMFVVVIYMFLNPKESLLTRQVIDQNEFLVHNLNNQFFQQGPNDQFEGYTINDARNFFNIGISDSPTLPSCEKIEDIEIPDSYDFRKDPKRKNCVDTPRICNNCTASHVLSVVSTVEDRICIANGGRERFRLSAQDAISCDTTNFNCEGGYVTHTLNYGRDYGFVKEECFPWEGRNATCPTEVNK